MDRYHTARDEFLSAQTDPDRIDCLFRMVRVLAEVVPVEYTARSESSTAHYHGRHLIKKLASGDYQYETSASVDVSDITTMEFELARASAAVDKTARAEVHRREALDQWKAAQPMNTEIGGKRS